MARSFTFETLNRRQIARLNRDAQEPYTLLGYEDTESRPLGLVGDDVGPYVHAIGRASTTGGDTAPTNVPVVDDGEAQRLLTDEYGRLWVNVNTTAAEVQNVQGNIANGASDASSYPVKVGGKAVANGSVDSAVDAGDRVDAAYTRNGAAHVVSSPNPIADATTYVYTVLSAVAGDATGRVVLKASPGRLRRIIVTNTSGVALFLQIHNTTLVGSIATGTILWPGIPVPASGGVTEIDFSEADLACSTGIAAALSTTQNTYTAAASAGMFAAQYA